MKNFKFPSRIEFLYTFIILIPVIIYLLAHYFTVEGRVSTGFTLGETPYYMANARQYLDHGFGSLFYGNPYSSEIDSPRIYFQFQTYALAILWKVFNFNPGVLWNLFGLFFGILFIFTVIKIIKKLVNPSQKNLLFLLIAFFWGGGIHSLLGGSVAFLKNGFNISEIIRSLEMFEVAEGWWMLNVGRNLLMANYTYYHFLVALVIWLYLSKRFNKALITLFVLSFSHPFVGVQTLFSLSCWGIFETFYLKSNELTKKQLLSLFGLLALHLAYYMVWLNLSPEHKVQESQWKTSTLEDLYTNWAMTAKTFAPSYIFIFGLWFYQVRTPEKFLEFFKVPQHRFLMFLALMNFVLANHEFAIPPIQPIHFTQGMIFAPLALLALPTIKELLIQKKVVVSIIFISVLCLDNITWMGKRIIQEKTGKTQTGFNINPEMKDVLNHLSKNYTTPDYLIVSKSKEISYFSSVYTGARTWLGHFSITPYNQLKSEIKEKFIKTKITPKEWIKDKVIFVSDQIEPLSNLVYQNAKYYIYALN